MWGFIAFIIIVAIALGITLHEAFWGVVGVIAALVITTLVIGTEKGRKLLIWCCIIAGYFLGAIVTYQGIVKKTGDEKQYEADIYSCDNDTWRYESAKKYTNNYQNYYYQNDKVQSIYQDCIQSAVNNSNARKQWWWVEAGGGLAIIYVAYATQSDFTKKPNKKHASKNSKRA